MLMTKLVMQRMLFALLCCLLLLSGCGPKEAKRYPVSGTVKFNDGVLPDGHLVLMSTDGSAPDAGPIKDGKFSFNALPGKKKVEITATREAGPVDPSMGAPPKKQYIAPQYNTE